VGPFALKQQPFGMIRVMKGQVFETLPFEGILGLGFASMSADGIDPFFDRVIKQKVLTHNEFAFFMNQDSEKPSALLWGGIDKDLYHGKIQMFPVVQANYWSLELVDFKVGNISMKSAGMGSKTVKRLIVDTGTTLFTAPSAMRKEIVKHVPTANCNDINDYPDLTYVLRGADGKTYDLVVTQMTYMVGAGGADCGAAIMPMDVGEEFGPAMLLGEVFMKHFFTVFDRGDGNEKNAKVGFAPANVDATPKVKSDGHAASFLERSQSISLDSMAQMRSSPVRRHAGHRGLQRAVHPEVASL